MATLFLPSDFGAQINARMELAARIGPHAVLGVHKAIVKDPDIRREHPELARACFRAMNRLMADETVTDCIDLAHWTDERTSNDG